MGLQTVKLRRASTHRNIQVLHVITRLVVGGAQENTLLTVRNLEPTRYDISLASGPSGGPEGSLEAEAAALGAAFFRIPHLVRSPNPVWDVLAFLSLYRLIRRNRYDIVHTHTTKAGLIGRLAARAAGVPIIVHTPHGHAFHGYLGALGSKALIFLERAIAKITDRIICLTEAEKEDHLRLGVGKPEKFVTIHSGVDIERFRSVAIDARDKRIQLHLPLTGPLIGCVARLVPVKGVHVLLEAVPIIRKSLPEATTVFVGDGSLREALERRASELGLDGAVVFAGLRRDVPELMHLFDVVVLPSLNEGMGKAAVEAMAAGRPVVGSRVAGIQNVVLHGRTGLLVTPGDPHELAEAIVAVLRNVGTSSAMGTAGRTWASAFSVADMIIEISRLYDALARQVLPLREA